jgi:hypothetical protein
MPISFVVGAAADVFPPDFARAVDAELWKRFPPPKDGNEEAWHSDRVEPDGWRLLQDLAKSMLGTAHPSQLTGVEAYQMVWVPSAFTSVEHIAIPNAADPLQVGSLPNLVEELRVFAGAASLPTDDVELMELAAHYLEDELSFDKDLDTQTYVQLMLAAKQAAARGQALWIGS